MNSLAVHRDLERAAARRHEGQGLDVVLEPQELFRQTDGLRLVVSSGAVFDANFQSHNGNVCARRLGADEPSVKMRPASGVGQILSHDHPE